MKKLIPSKAMNASNKVYSTRSWASTLRKKFLIVRDMLVVSPLG